MYSTENIRKETDLFVFLSLRLNEENSASLRADFDANASLSYAKLDQLMMENLILSPTTNVTYHHNCEYDFLEKSTER